MRTLYFDCFAGVSGNMILGGLIAAGVEPEELTKRIRAFAPSEVELRIETVDRSGISATHVNVIVPDEARHRHLSDIQRIIADAELSESVKTRSVDIFTRLAEAEARVHGVGIDKVHFHEVGAMDAIVDIVGACIGFEMLGIQRFACSAIHVGSGFVDMDHGKYPVPPPAVAELLKGIPFYSTEIRGELATPTGVAIVSTVCDSFGVVPRMTGDRAAYGAGTRVYDKFPNVLRLMVGDATEPMPLETLSLLETNIDDLSPQVLGYVMERSFELGALDCWFTPIQMKKNRPAAMLSVLCEVEKRPALADLIYRETSTLGIRVKQIERECLDREMESVETAYGSIDVKIARLDGRIVNAMPEYEQVRSAALANDVSFTTVRDAALAAVGSAKTRSAGH
jgi:pyridinium-3,5-bisthiocarboxylic acid mononucleotide nickel chelatase